jgi:ABC-type glycerol-3-phosphate transport system substrate-binding protein
MQRRLLLFLTTLLALIIGIVPMAAAQAQDGTTTIQLSVPQFMRQIISDQLISDFETANPTIKVNVLSNDNNGGEAASGVDALLTSAQAYASTADVLFVDNSNLSVQATRAGYYLDMTPLTSSDTALNVDDFIPGVWQSFQWDNGIWALPVSTDIIILTYDPAAFDKIGLAYPNERWTMDDLDKATRKLAVVDPSGAVTTAGLSVSNFNVQWLFRSLLGKGFYDASVTPNAPLLSDPALQTMMATWAKLVSDKMVSSQGGFAAADTVPMQIGGSRTLGRRPGNNRNQVVLSASLLPGGGAGLNPQGFAISSGTQYPEQAYALAKFLTSSPDVGNNFFGISPARQSLVGAKTSNNNNGGGPGGNSGGPVFVGPGGPGGGLNNLSDANKAVVTQALASGIPLSEVRFGDYVVGALSKMSSDGSDAQTALQTLEAQAVADLQAADNAKTANPVVLATPVPEVVLQSGQVALKFGLNSFASPLPNQDKWNQLIADFTANDPQVKDIKLDVQSFGGNQFASTDDCFYLPTNNVPGIDLSTIVNLDPFIDSDSSFDKNDAIGNTLSLITRDNKIWAYPLALQPAALEYNSDVFTKYNVPDPSAGWTINGFTDALKSIKVDPSDAAPFASREPGGTYLLMLIAAYGGIPLDYRTSPPTLDLTSQKNVDAIRQVLDLAKNGYLKYDKLASNTFIFTADQADESIYDTVLNGFSFRGRRGGGPGGVGQPSSSSTTTSYKLTSYPTGTDYSAVSYDVTTAYISATSQNPEGCYRWISYLGKHPEVLDAMPAFRSQLTDVATVQSANAASFYTLLDNLIQQPNTIVFPSQGGGFNSPANFLLQFWMNRAFDNYVLNNGDLDQDLKDAQTYSTAFQECVANIPPFDPATQDRRQFFTAYGKCAQQADPTISGLFGPGAGG